MPKFNAIRNCNKGIHEYIKVKSAPDKRGDFDYNWVCYYCGKPLEDKIRFPKFLKDRNDYTFDKKPNFGSHWIVALLLMMVSLCIGIVCDAKRNFIGLEFFVFLSFAIFLFAILILIKFKK